MSQRPFIIFGIFLTLQTITSEAQSAVAVISESHSITATAGTGTQTDTSSSSPASVSGSEQNSTTVVTTNWVALGSGTDTLTYTSTGSIVASKSQNAKPGVDHFGSSTVCMDFQPDANGSFSFTGTVTDIDLDGTNDPFTWSITGPSLSVSGSDPTSISGSGAVVAGNTYTLKIITSATETSLNQMGTRSRNWDTTLTVTAVPEPSTAWLLCSSAFGLVLVRRRRGEKLNRKNLVAERILR